MSEKQMWNTIETEQTLMFLDRLHQRIKIFGMQNMDENTNRCLTKLAEVYEAMQSDKERSNFSNGNG